MADDLRDKAAEVVRKILTVGVGAAFLTEESLRALVSEVKLPKELLGGVLDSAGRTRKEFFQRLSTDIIDRVKDRIDPGALVQEILSNNDIELNIKVSFKPKDPKVKASVQDSD
jgi:hypothetical protein